MQSLIETLTVKNGNKIDFVRILYGLLFLQCQETFIYNNLQITPIERLLISSQRAPYVINKDNKCPKIVDLIEAIASYYGPCNIWNRTKAYALYEPLLIKNEDVGYYFPSARERINAKTWLLTKLSECNIDRELIDSFLDHTH